MWCHFIWNICIWLGNHELKFKFNWEQPQDNLLHFSLSRSLTNSICFGRTIVYKSGKIAGFTFTDLSINKPNPSKSKFSNLKYLLEENSFHRTDSRRKLYTELFITRCGADRVNCVAEMRNQPVWTLTIISKKNKKHEQIIGHQQRAAEQFYAEFQKHKWCATGQDQKPGN